MTRRAGDRPSQASESRLRHLAVLGASLLGGALGAGVGGLALMRADWVPVGAALGWIIGQSWVLGWLVHDRRAVDPVGFLGTAAVALAGVTALGLGAFVAVGGQPFGQALAPPVAVAAVLGSAGAVAALYALFAVIAIADRPPPDRPDAAADRADEPPHRQ